MSGEWLAAVVENRSVMRTIRKAKAKEIDIQSETDDCNCIETVVDLPLWAQAVLFDSDGDDN